jgi:malonyl-CoA/methylmalonyl-CoA synthetase
MASRFANLIMNVSYQNMVSVHKISATKSCIFSSNEKNTYMTIIEPRPKTLHTVNAVIFDKLAEHNDPYLITPDYIWTGAAFHELVMMLSEFLHQSGLNKGDRLLAQVEKSPASLALYVATLKAGGVYIPLNTSYTIAELDYFIGDAEPSFVILSTDRAASMAGHYSDKTLFALDADGTGQLMDSARNMLKSPNTDKNTAPMLADDPVTGDDLAAILYTSGTTGRSKGAMLTHRNLVSNAITLTDYWQFTDQDILLHALPIYHTHGLFVASHVATLSGGRMIFLSKFDPDTICHWLPQATTMMGVPTFYTRLLAMPEFDHALTAHIRLFISGSAPLLDETHTAFHERTGHAILERYGMTETSMNTSNPYMGDRRPGSIGFALPGVSVRLSDDAGSNGIGMIEVKGDNVFSGYWNKPDQTSDSFTDDGYFRTGDLAMISDDGYISIIGRQSDMIISGGLNIYPKEIEDALNDIDGISESAVIGIPDADFGEQVMAVIVADPEHVTAEQVAARLADRLARFKHPKSLIFADALPRNAMGKVEKKRLRQIYGDA